MSTDLEGDEDADVAEVRERVMREGHEGHALTVMGLTKFYGRLGAVRDHFRSTRQGVLRAAPNPKFLGFSNLRSFRESSTSFWFSIRIFVFEYYDAFQRSFNIRPDSILINFFSDFPSMKNG